MKNIAFSIFILVLCGCALIKLPGQTVETVGIAIKTVGQITETGGKIIEAVAQTPGTKEIIASKVIP